MTETLDDFIRIHGSADGALKPGPYCWLCEEPLGRERVWKIRADRCDDSEACRARAKGRHEAFRAEYLRSRRWLRENVWPTEPMRLP